MAYVDQKMGGGRIVAIVIVALIHIALGYAFVTGLAYQYIKKQAEKLNTFDVEEPPPPPPPDVPPPPPPPDQKFTPPPVVTPPPIVQTPVPPVNVVRSVPTPPPAIVYTPVAAPPAPPAPPAPRQTLSQAAGLKGNPGQYFSDDNYPPAAIRAEAQGRVVARLSVGVDGRVTDCSISTSTGNSDLDNATCRIAKSRVRFTPAKDATGANIASSYNLAVRWVLPDS